MKIYTIDDPEFGYKGDQVALSESTCTYVQTNDCTEEDGVQDITLSSRDGGGGRFINIKTDSWSIASPKELAELIEDFCKRIDLKDD